MTQFSRKKNFIYVFTAREVSFYVFDLILNDIINAFINSTKLKGPNQHLARPRPPTKNQSQYVVNPNNGGLEWGVG